MATEYNTSSCNYSVETLSNYGKHCAKQIVTRDVVSASGWITFISDLPPTEQEKSILTSIYLMIIIPSIILNAMVLWRLIIFKLRKKIPKRRPRADNFIISLCVSDLITTLVVIPSNAYRIANDSEWNLIQDNHKFNLWTCKLSSYFMSTATISGMLLLTALSIDRLGFKIPKFSVSTFQCYFLAYFVFLKTLSTLLV